MPQNHGTDAPDATPGAADLDPTHPALALEAVTVTTPGGPDRRTIYPRDMVGVPLMATWITANASVFVDLGAAR